MRSPTPCSAPSRPETLARSSRPAIRPRLAELLNVEPEAVGVKAKTPEGLNLDNTAVAHVVVLLGRS
jgi:2C-methyl-D-erythritol 2,4-cyclodiphosphate synthase